MVKAPTSVDIWALEKILLGIGENSFVCYKLDLLSKEIIDDEVTLYLEGPRDFDLVVPLGDHCKGCKL